MLRILIADGTPAGMQAEREMFGIPANASLFDAALRSQRPISNARRLMLPMAKTCRTACRLEISTA
jgi:hypothetical protein